MRRVMMLALLALFLPTAALAGTITFDTGFVPYFNGIVLLGFNSVFAAVDGPTYSIALSAPYNPATTEIMGGTITVANNLTGATVFQSSVITGTALCGPSLICMASGSLGPSATTTGGFFGFLAGDGIDIKVSQAVVSATLVPEPSALEDLLLGTGMLGFVEVMRRKLRLGI